jgi:hypothetical protein
MVFLVYFEETRDIYEKKNYNTVSVAVLPVLAKSCSSNSRNILPG